MTEKLLSKVNELLKKEEKKKFKQSLEVMINLKAKSVKLEGEDKVDLTIHLPKGRGKDIAVGIFAEGDLNLKAKKVSKHVLNKKELEKYAQDKRKMRKFANSCYFFLAQADLMPLIGKTWGVVLGPRGKMPQPIPPNIDPAPIVKKLQDNVKIKSKKNPTIQAPFGIEEMPAEDLVENLNTVIAEVKKQIPPEKISSIYIKRTMGQPVKIS